MFKQAEILLNPVISILAFLFLVFVLIRIRAIYFKKKPRIPIWRKDLKPAYKIGGIFKAIALPLMTAGIIYYLFIILIFTAVLFPFIKAIFVLVFSFWAILETYLSLSVPKNLPNASIFRRIIFYFTVLVCFAGAAFLFPKILRTYPFPNVSECVILDLPVRGEWLAGHAGATTTTNAHSKNRYAADFLKIGSDGRFYKVPEEEVTDFYSYNQPVYAPADGQVTEAVDSFPSDHMGDRDIENPGGNHVIMDIGNGKYFYVGHLRKGKVLVHEGQSVRVGDILGYIGNSGNTYFPHLHIHVQNNPRAKQEGRITYPFRFKKLKRRRLVLSHTVKNGALIRNDRIHD